MRIGKYPVEKIPPFRLHFQDRECLQFFFILVFGGDPPPPVCLFAFAVNYHNVHIIAGESEMTADVGHVVEEVMHMHAHTQPTLTHMHIATCKTFFHTFIHVFTHWALALMYSDRINSSSLSDEGITNFSGFIRMLQQGFTEI